MFGGIDFMNEKFITEVLQMTMQYLDQEQCRKLNENIHIVLQKYELKERCTELMDPDNSYIEYLNLFLKRKEIEGKSERTIEQYRLHLSRMLCYFNKAVDKIRENDLFVYLVKYKNIRKVSNTYLNNIRRVFSSFFGWLNNKGFISENPAIGLEKIKTEKKIRKGFTDEELDKLKRACKQKRDLALIEFMYSTGVRASELVSLNINAIDFYLKSVIVHGKGNKERETYLTPIALAYLKEYLDTRKDNNDALFVSTRSPYNRLSVAGVERILKNLGKSAGVENVHPHRFRRTMATNILSKGMPIEEVKELLGHSKLDTTMIYCTVNKENVKHTHQRLMSA